MQDVEQTIGFLISDVTRLLRRNFNRRARELGLSLAQCRALAYLFLYNFIFVLPLIIILLAIYFGASTMRLKKWRQENRRWMNLASGILMISLGALLIAYYKLEWFL